MRPIPTEEFAALLRELSAEEFAAFVAELWAARGWTTERREGLVVARKDGRRRALRTVAPRGRLRRWLGGGPTADAEGMDAVVTAGPGDEWSDGTGASDGAGAPDGVETIGAAELRDIALYGLDRGDCERLFREFFDRSPTVTEPTSGTGAPRLGRSQVAFALGGGLLLLLAVGLLGGVGGVDSDPGTAGAVGGAAGAGGARATDGAGAGGGGTDGASAAAGTDGDDRPTVTGPAPPNGGDRLREDLYARVTAEYYGNRSYRLLVVYQEYRDGEQVGSQLERVAVENDSRYRADVGGDGLEGRRSPLLGATSQYADGERRYAVDADGRVGVEPLGETPPPAGAIPTTGERAFLDRIATAVRWYLSVGDAAVTPTAERDGVTYYRVTSTSDPYPGVDNASTVAVIDERGVVHSLRREHRWVGRDTTSFYSFRFDAAGETEVTPPPWYPPAGGTVTVDGDATAGGNETTGG